MAVDFKTKHTRTSEYLFLPEDLTVKPELNGRYKLPEIDSLIESFLSMGQLQPCLIGNDGGKPVLYAGHCRWRAALEINKRGLTPKPFKLRCVYFRGDEKAAFLSTIAENHKRRQTTPLDDAYNMQKLEQVYGMSVEEIAAEYGEKVSWVKGRLALLDLSMDAAKALSEGRMDESAAVHIAKLSKEAQKQRIASVGDGKITVAVAKFDPNAPEKPKRIGLKQENEFWGPYAERTDNRPMTRFARVRSEWLKDGDTEKFFRAVSDILEPK